MVVKLGELPFSRLHRQLRVLVLMYCLYTAVLRGVSSLSRKVLISSDALTFSVQTRSRGVAQSFQL